MLSDHIEGQVTITIKRVLATTGGGHHGRKKGNSWRLSGGSVSALSKGLQSTIEVKHDAAVTLCAHTGSSYARRKTCFDQNKVRASGQNQRQEFMRPSHSPYRDAF